MLTPWPLIQSDLIVFMLPLSRHALCDSAVRMIWLHVDQVAAPVSVSLQPDTQWILLALGGRHVPCCPAALLAGSAYQHGFYSCGPPCSQSTYARTSFAVLTQHCKHTNRATLYVHFVRTRFQSVVLWLAAAFCTGSNWPARRTHAAAPSLRNQSLGERRGSCAHARGECLRCVAALAPPSRLVATASASWVFML
jgi:hypothetical protein